MKKQINPSAVKPLKHNMNHKDHKGHKGITRLHRLSQEIAPQRRKGRRKKTKKCFVV
jgi:hypothetical protein